MGTTNERLQLILSLAKGPAVLHVGCVGTTVPRTIAEDNHCLHSQLCKTFGQRGVLGIDINRAGVQEMTEKGFTVLVCDAENMDLGPRCFDTIVAGELIEHLANPGRFLVGCLRHLKPSGRVILSTPNVFSMMAYLLYVKNFTRSVHPEHTSWFCAQTLMQLAERSGFRVSRTLFVDDLRPDIEPSRWYKSFCFLYRTFGGFMSQRFRNTIVAVLELK